MIQTYTIEDCPEYYPSQYTLQASSERIENQITLLTQGDIIVEGELSATNKGYGVELGTTSSTDYNYVRIGVGGANNRGGGICINPDNQNLVLYDTYTSYSTPFVFKFVREGSTYSLYINDELVTTQTNSTISNAQYLRLHSWSTSKTITLSNVKVKPL